MQSAVWREHVWMIEVVTGVKETKGSQEEEKAEERFEKRKERDVHMPAV